MESDSIMHLQHGPMMTSPAVPFIAAKVRLIRISVFEFLSRSEGVKLERISEDGEGCFVRLAMLASRYAMKNGGYMTIC